MPRRRRTQWIDSADNTLITVLGAGFPGTIVDQIQLLEAEIEEPSGQTLTRTIGDLWVNHLAGGPIIVSATLWIKQAYAGAVAVTNWSQDAYQREAVIGTWYWLVSAISANGYGAHVRVDLRSKRKLSKGTELLLSWQNHSAAGNNVTVASHLRFLTLLP